MNVAFACPQCQETSRAELSDATVQLACDHCGELLSVPVGVVSGGRVQRCVVCPSTELYVRKDMPQRLGVAIVVVGLGASCVAWYFYQVLVTFGIMFATAAIDFVLYLVMGNVLQCYRCHAQYRGGAGLDEYSPFSLESHERHRQQTARMADAKATSARSGASG